MSASMTTSVVVVLLSLIILLACRADRANDNPTPIMSIDHLGVHVNAYAHGIMRVTIRDSSRWVYEVEHVLVEEPVLTGPAAQCTNSGGESQCTATNADCTMSLVRMPAVDDTHVATLSIMYACDGVELVSVSVPLSCAGEKLQSTFTFPAAATLYGLPEHAADLVLRPGNTYELMNRDAFQYGINSTEALYGAVPFIMAYAPAATTGVLFLNSAPMNVVVQHSAQPSCEWSADGGVVDILFLPGSTPAKVQRQHAFLTGSVALPPYFSLGFHQCRWNYMSTRDCLSVDEGFDKHNLPYDVLWLDIEHTDKKKYFTWDKDSFPNPKVLTSALASKGRKLVTVKDPHVKREDSYVVHEEAVRGNHYVQSRSGGDYIGQCWPGTSSWPDFLKTATREWYATFFHDDRYQFGSRDVHTWVDMNEPSEFGGPRGTMNMDAVHTTDDGKPVEHRHLHNLYGLLAVMSAYKGAREAAGPEAPEERPFILTRSFFAGTQRYAAVWNGDNMARWDHLENTAPELLSLSLSNAPFCGADIGGFFFDPEEELFVRWMQAAIFYPFMRSHAHLESKRREPWTFSETAFDHIRNALALRYALVPYLYTTFFHAHKDGDTVLRPLIYDFPLQADLREEQHSFMFGPALLAAPIVAKGATELVAQLPADTLWFSYGTGELAGSGLHRERADLGTIPLFLRGGYVVPVKLRLRRSTLAMQHDPFTLLVAINQHGNSHGDLYVDDGRTYAFEHGDYVHRQFSYSAHTLSCRAVSENNPIRGQGYGRRTEPFAALNEVERIVMYGFQGKPTSVTLTIDGNIATPLEFERVGATLIVRKPNVHIDQDWVITFHQ